MQGLHGTSHDLLSLLQTAQHLHDIAVARTQGDKSPVRNASGIQGIDEVELTDLSDGAGRYDQRLIGSGRHRQCAELAADNGRLRRQGDFDQHRPASRIGLWHNRPDGSLDRLGECLDSYIEFLIQ